MSLETLLRFYAAPFYKATGQLFRFQVEIQEQLKNRDKDSLLTDSELDYLKRLLDVVERECEKIRLKRSLERIALFRNRDETLGRMLIVASELTLGDVEQELEELQRSIRMDLYDPTFVFIPEDFKHYCDNKKIFDTDDVKVSERFPRANAEFTEAGNCFAVQEYTATIFHLMRGLEHGLRALAKAVSVPFPKRYDQKTWGVLIGEIQTKIDNMKLLPKSPKRSKDLEFFNGAAAQFRFFQNAWRDYVMHTKEKHPYDYHEASRVMEHTRDFMRHIAPRLKEQK